MAKRPLLAPDTLRQLLRYEPETGRLFWKERGSEWFKDNGANGAKRSAAIWNGKYAGKEAMTANSHGYCSGSLFNRNYESHRVIWALHHGQWAENEIDHINGDRSDNRLDNLREATSSQNKMNRSLQANNTSGFVGVSFHSRHKHWRSYIKVGGNTMHLGCFETREDAIAARDKATREIHGKFARR